MRRAFQIGVFLALAVVPAPADQAQSVAPGGPARKNGVPKKALPKAGPPLRNPMSPAARLYQATPEQRERVLEKLPPRQQELLRRQLEAFDSLPEDERRLRIQQAERFERLTPEQRRAFREQLSNVRQLPPARRRAVVNVLRRLQEATDEQRSAFLQSRPFQNRFTPEEQQIIQDLTAIMPPRAED